MLETVILLRPKRSWRSVPTWYSSWAPDWVKPIFRRITSDHISKEDLVSQMNRALTFPGVANAWSMPIRGRIDMLTTGIRTAVGIKIAGNTFEDIERLGAQIDTLLPSLPGTRGVFAERLGQGYFADIQWNRAALSRNGLTMEDAQAAVQYAIGGDNVTTMLEGRERYPVSVRYLGDFRDNLDALARIIVQSPAGRQIPIAEIAEVRTRSGPTMLRNENGLLTGYVYVDVSATDLAGYIEQADRLLRAKLPLPQGCSISWSGQYEGLLRMNRRLAEIVPLTLLLIVLLLYFNTQSLPKTVIVLLAVPFSAVGAIWFLYFLGYHMSVAVWVGMIALMGVDAETGIFMLLYLDHSYQQAKREQRMHGSDDLRQAILQGAARRLRPKFMTVATMFVGLVPIMWSVGTGSDVMKRIAAPMIGGILTSFVLELVVYPMAYYVWRLRSVFEDARVSENPIN